MEKIEKGAAPMDQVLIWLTKSSRHFPRPLLDLATTAFFMALAYWVSRMLLEHTGAENNSALVYVLAVLFIALLTNSYIYGIGASVFGAFCINFFFMKPYAQFSLSYAGYPVAMVSMLVIAIICCALTAKTKNQAVEAARREQSTKELYEANERLNAEKNAIQLEAARETIRSNILRAVSHDLRTPLTGISGAATVLLSSEEMYSEKSISLLQDIRNDANSLIAMVENILSVTRIRDGTMTINKQPEMLEEVAGDAALTVRRRFPDCAVRLELSDDILYLEMDPILIKQVIINLLENAIRHSGDRENILLSLCRKDDWAVVEVRDHGRGLSEDVLQAIREGRQFMPQSNDKSRGMGIGLSVCQSIIQIHEGFFEAENSPSGGAVFRFGLPVKEIDYE